MRTSVGPTVRLSAVVIRACELCHGKRELGKVCKTCGNTKPPVVKDLGVIAARERSWWESVKWNCWGYHVAQRRIKKTNKEQLAKNLGECG
jgi:hypothetical protein